MMVGINKNPIILKNNVIHNIEEFPDIIKNKIHSKKRCNKKNHPIFKGEKVIFFV